MIFNLSCPFQCMKWRQMKTKCTTINILIVLLLFGKSSMQNVEDNSMSGKTKWEARRHIPNEQYALFQ